MNTLSYHEKFTEYLIKNGWVYYHCSYFNAGNWFKRFREATTCKCNSDKLGVQVCIAVYKHQETYNYEMDLTAEKKDGVWVKFQLYSLPDDLMGDCEEQALELIKAWEAVNK